MNHTPDEDFAEPMKCPTCTMALPMANGQPMPMACLKCYPNGAETQKKKLERNPSKEDLSPFSTQSKKYGGGDDDSSDYDDGDDSDDDDGDDDEEE